jgi:hypothetical protein
MNNLIFILKRDICSWTCALKLKFEKLTKHKQSSLLLATVKESFNNFDTRGQEPYSQISFSSQLMNKPK